MDRILKPLFNLGVMGAFGGFYCEIFNFEVFTCLGTFFVCWVAVKNLEEFVDDLLSICYASNFPRFAVLSVKICVVSC